MIAAAVTPVFDTETVLNRAADFIDRFGWSPDAHPASLISALRAAVLGRDLDGAALHAYTAACEWLNTYLIAIGSAGLHAAVFDWQHAPGRTPAQVTAALRAAGAAYRDHERRNAT